jgi:glucoamylase
MESLGEWLERQYRHSARAMLRSVSATSITKIRAGFDQRITPRKGSVVASPVPGAYDPYPDYFYHWFRDSALVMDALRILCREAAALTGQFKDFVRFSLALEQLDGAELQRAAQWRGNVHPEFRQFVRSEGELSLIRGERVVADTRVNPDGTLDISRWARPQNDGPPLRALCVMRWLRDIRLDAGTVADAEVLLRRDLEFTLRHWAEPCFDIWEEESGFHYYTQRICGAALAQGAKWLLQNGDPAGAEYAQTAQAIMQRLDSFWSEPGGFLRSRLFQDGRISGKELDISVLLAAIHSGSAGAHSPADPRLLATLGKLEALFDAEYTINRGRSAQRGPALGRYSGDVYFSGGAYYFSTLGAAELCYRAAAVAPRCGDLISRGDAFLETVREFTPADGELSEQFDQNTGAPNSAPQLAWSYAAVISSVTARDAVVTRRDA